MPGEVLIGPVVITPSWGGYIMLNSSANTTGLDRLSSIALTSEDGATLKPHPYRWWLLAIQAYLSLTSSFAIVCYFGITNELGDLVGRDPECKAIAIFSGVVWLVSCAGKIPAMWSADRLGPMKNLAWGCLFIVTGPWIRLAFPTSFAALFVGTVVTQLGQPLIQVLPAMITEFYFPFHERALATSIGVVMEFFGVGLGMGLGTNFRHDIVSLWWVCAIINTAAVPLLLFCLYKVETRCALKHVRMCDAMKQLARNPSFRLGFVAMGILFGVFNTVLTNLATVAPPDLQFLIGHYALIFFSCGLIGAAVTGWFVDKYESQLHNCICFCAIAVYTIFGVQCLFWQLHWPYAIMITAGMCGFLGPSIPSLVMRFTLAYTDCRGIESVVNSLILVPYGFVAAILIPLTAYKNNTTLLWVLWGVTSPGIIALLLMRKPTGLDKRSVFVDENDMETAEMGKTEQAAGAGSVGSGGVDAHTAFNGRRLSGSARGSARGSVSSEGINVELNTSLTAARQEKLTQDSAQFYGGSC